MKRQRLRYKQGLHYELFLELNRRVPSFLLSCLKSNKTEHYFLTQSMLRKEKGNFLKYFFEVASDFREFAIASIGFLKQSKFSVQK